MNRKEFFVAVIVLAFLVLLLSASGVVAQGPAPAGGTIAYTGRLNNDAGRSVVDGVYAFTFALYNAAKDGNLLWSETQPGVIVKNGAFTARLVSVTPLPKEARISKGWLAVSVRGPGEMEFTALAPRQELNVAVAASPSSPAAPSSCLHDHFGEAWSGNALGTTAGVRLSVVDTQLNGTGISGSASNGADASGVAGYSTGGIGVMGFTNAGGISILAAGPGGRLQANADSTLWLSPHSMVNRGSANVTLTPLENGAVTVANQAGAEDKYLSIPVSTFGPLFGSPVYVKSVAVCYAAGSTGRIRATAVTCPRPKSLMAIEPVWAE